MAQHIISGSFRVAWGWLTCYAIHMTATGTAANRPNAITLGTVGMSDGTTRDARRLPDGVVQFWTFGNANNTRGHGWRKASTAQAATFAPDA